jgi:hypothetical protein
MMSLASNATSPVRDFNEVLPLDMSKLITKADMVPTTAMEADTTVLVSLCRWWAGKRRPITSPIMAPPKSANWTIRAMPSEVVVIA